LCNDGNDEVQTVLRHSVIESFQFQNFFPNSSLPSRYAKHGSEPTEPNYKIILSYCDDSAYFASSDAIRVQFETAMCLQFDCKLLGQLLSTKTSTLHWISRDMLRRCVLDSYHSQKSLPLLIRMFRNTPHRYRTVQNSLRLIVLRTFYQCECYKMTFNWIIQLLLGVYYGYLTPFQDCNFRSVSWQSICGYRGKCTSALYFISSIIYGATIYVAGD
jgi:hypothetical protein